MASVMFPVDLAYLVDAGGPDRQLAALYAANHLRRHRVVLVVLRMRQNSTFHTMISLSVCPSKLHKDMF
jgi:hypothetical protein